MKKSLQNVAGSLKYRMPIITVPTAPMPVQTAYAVPIGKFSNALFKKTKLSTAQTKKPKLHFNTVKFFERFKQVVKPISKQPAIIRYIQLMLQR
ncbi:hypothetical protein SAMN04488023_101191 [Pedobacter rhizosphaerae]|uniref:Uncharacterized protein n=1 Tax=Pedobacter rhizosphaerae TaxID=390241 RepID=A0A1H9J218_9SPHI|nr:hypothetical protein SAMN04488023_101191 [Pedobacter rhizosphaerae]